MFFIATCVDKPRTLDMGKANRPAPLAYLNGLGRRVKIGSALLRPDHRTPVGSKIVFEGENEDEILALVAKDPFSLAGLFESVSVKPRRQGVGQLLA
jgi:uncharacterized protein YciI